MPDLGYPQSVSLEPGRVRRTQARVLILSPSQTLLDGLAVLFGIALMASVYLSWISVSHAHVNDSDASIQALD